VFPADNYWNSRVDSANVHPSSAAWVSSIGAATRLHADFSGNLADGFGFTPRTVTASQPPSRSTSRIPRRAIRADADPARARDRQRRARGERHRDHELHPVRVLRHARERRLELERRRAAKWTLSSNALRPDGWESGDQAGFPYLVGLLRWEEVAAGEINHAIRITANNASNTYLWPARHPAFWRRRRSEPCRHSARASASSFVRHFRVRCADAGRAARLQEIRPVLASRGGNWYMQGVSDPGWADAIISELQSIAGSNFEAVDTAPLMINANSGQAVQLAAPGGGGGSGVSNPAIAQVYDGGVVLASVVQPDGKVIIGGEFEYVNGVARQNIARLNADGSLDTSWNPGASSFVAALALDAGGNVYAGGNFGFIGGGAGRNFVAKLSPSGVADAAWNPGANNVVGALALDGAGNIYVGGDFNTIGGQSRNRVARLSTSGTGAADGWNPNADGFIWAIAPDNAGNVFVGGLFNNIGGVQRNYLARVSAANGATDVSWNSNIDTNGNNGVHAMVIANGMLYAGGEWFTIAGQSRAYLARFPTSGSGAADTSWSPNAGSTMYALATDGTNLYAGGAFNSIGGQARNGVARIPLSGATADGWNPNATAPVRSISLGGGNAYVGGHFPSLGGATKGGFGAISTSSGSAVPGWPSVFNPGQVFAIARDPSGRTIIGGQFITMGDGTTLRSNIARFNADGSLDATWNPNSNGHVAALLPDTSGNIYAGGFFSFIGGQTRGYLARLSASSGAADSWNPTADYIVWTLAGDSAGNVYAVASSAPYAVCRVRAWRRSLRTARWTRHGTRIRTTGGCSRWRWMSPGASTSAASSRAWVASREIGSPSFRRAPGRSMPRGMPTRATKCARLPWTRAAPSSREATSGRSAGWPATTSRSSRAPRAAPMRRGIPTATSG
jgi:hypothetical protein